ncbi:VOC family protein [Nocardioides astragali]|uniref:VOC family protein n=1 Tax=Nocardioides astragali TaxID=1776736 RepID=A0ABW2N4F6_9ACTN|nr:VOC family protein [Nocardioides astragali]
MGWSRDLVDPTVLATLGRRFYLRQIARLADLGIDAGGYAVSHVAVRAPTWTEYVFARAGLEQFALSNVENVWNGRPISKIVLRTPLDLGPHEVELIELIPPFHQRVYAMGPEHVGLVVGPDLERFVDRHVEVLTGRQFQSRGCRPAYRLFEDYTHVKFYERSLMGECILEGARFEGFSHAAWDPADPDAGPYELGCPGD